MKKFALCLSLALCVMAMSAYAEENPVATTSPSVASSNEEKTAPVLSQEELLKEAIAKMPTDNYVENISAEEMHKRLEAGRTEDILYIKFDEENVLVYEYLSKDSAACEQLLYASPKEMMLNCYSNNEATIKQLYKSVRKHKSERNLIDGMKVAGAKSTPTTIEHGKVYKLWYQKVKADNRIVRVKRRGFNLPIPIGIGFPIGGGRHRPHIGIGL